MLVKYTKERLAIGYWVMGIASVSAVALPSVSFFVLKIPKFIMLWQGFLCVVIVFALSGFITGYFYSYRILTRLHIKNDYSTLKVIMIGLLSFILVYLMGALIMIIPIALWNIFTWSTMIQSIWDPLIHAFGSSLGLMILSFIYFGFLGLIIAPISCLIIHKRYKRRIKK